ncbi:hypothetical protein EV648_103267 [Kribbella sp. VKM Ac-2568]|nr:hypothetical protein EV648_103267 [Kribbella sp. VKM Ac-2568]
MVPHHRQHPGRCCISNRSRTGLPGRRAWERWPSVWHTRSHDYQRDLRALLETDGAYTLERDGAFTIARVASCSVLKAIADDVLAQGLGVVIDSPCFYDELLAAGQALAAKHGVAYRYIECVTEDIGLLDTRLRSRPALRSQRPSVDELLSN